jgi:hypothetical protein
MINATSRGDSRLAIRKPGTDTPEDARALAFTRLTAARLASCYRLATVILADPVEAEDATHDAAVRAWERWGCLSAPLPAACPPRHMHQTARMRTPQPHRREGAGSTLVISEIEPHERAGTRSAPGIDLAATSEPPCAESGAPKGA